VQTLSSGISINSTSELIPEDEGFSKRPTDASPDTIDSDLLSAVMLFSTPIHFSPGDRIISQGENEKYFYYIKQGSVAVSYSEGWTQIVVALIGQGNFIGEIGFFDGLSRVREARAVNQTLVMRFDTDCLNRLLLKQPLIYSRFILYLTRTICSKFRRVLEDREPLKGYSTDLPKISKERTTSLPENFFYTDSGEKTNRLVEEFKSSMFDLSHRLQADSGDVPPEDLKIVGFSILDQFKDQLEDLADRNIDPEIKPYMWSYVFKEIFPYFMRSRFNERVYYKPRGYAGDYLMIDMIYANMPKGDGKLGTVVDAWALNSKAPQAVRGRRVLLADQLRELSRGINGKGPSLNIMNLACGPCREISDFLSQPELEKKFHFLLVDIDDEALQYADRRLKPFSRNHRFTFVCENIIKWAIGRSKQDFGPQDIIYSSGLMDYLEDRFFVKLLDRCFERLNPGGALLIGNFGPRNPDRAFMDNILQWNLIYRSESELKHLFSKSLFRDNVEIIAEPLGVNLFVKAMKC
jgi:extracellular factor (EF) 3-hydroxypalmitic acid methyl ester biosynthesis protein